VNIFLSDRSSSSAPSNTGHRGKPHGLVLPDGGPWEPSESPMTEQSPLPLLFSSVHSRWGSPKTWEVSQHIHKPLDQKEVPGAVGGNSPSELLQFGCRLWHKHGNGPFVPETCFHTQMWE
jgi:hypothetical protein